MNLIFDFDGTLCNSISPAVDVVNVIFSEIGYKKTDIKEIQLNGLKGLVKSRKIPATRVAKIISDYRKRSASIYDYAFPFQGIKNALKKLTEKHNLGILTTNQIKNVNKFLNKYDMNYFNFIYSESDVFGKHLGLKRIISEKVLSPKVTYYIGDETRDIDAAKKIAIKSIAVTWGAESKRLLSKSNPDYIISKPTEIQRIWK